MIDIDLILRSAIAGIVGGEIANWLSGKNRAVKPSFFILYSLCFTTIYSLTILFFYIIYLIKGFLIPWFGLFITSSLISFFVSISLILLDKYRDK